MPALPNTIALQNIATGADILSADHRTNYAAIQAAVNAIIAAANVDAKGDLLAATADNTLINLAVGANALVLMADSAQASGMKWGGSYAAYVPTWAATGVAPAIGNGTNVAHYVQIGKMIHAWGLIAFGATSTFGTGSYTFALPANAVGGLDLLGAARLSDNSAAALGVAEARVATVSTMQIVYGATYLGVETSIGQLAPWTWAQNDQIAWAITYEAA